MGEIILHQKVLTPCSTADSWDVLRYNEFPLQVAEPINYV